MKNILITGAGSYIGSHIAAYLPERTYTVRQLDLRRGLDPRAFEGQDVVIHVAGIAHQKETTRNKGLYQSVNCDLAVETAELAKKYGVKQFIFFSSMSVYGKTTGRITADTKPAPNTYYGQSKWDAEQKMALLADDHFRIAMLRPPMIYGKGCRGNYPRLAALAKKLPVFPQVHNQRSMLYIGTLCEFVRQLIESGKGGLYFPQNCEYVNTTELVTAIADCHGKKLMVIPGFGWLIRLVESHVGVVGKVFGTLTYDKSMSQEFADHGLISFEQTIRRTEAE
ncbi:MAG: NAD-dependent epimerase/dehydratase family protein [Clostridia bacterium]|nr:NAD-dependent epimerase/dehydratase family protein [Clostridia bacterium]